MAFVTDLTGTLIYNTFVGGAPSGIANDMATFLQGGSDTSTTSYTALGGGGLETSIISGVGGVDAAITGTGAVFNKQDGEVILGTTTGLAGVAFTLNTASNSVDTARTPASATRILTIDRKLSTIAGNYNMFDGKFTPALSGRPIGADDIARNFSSWVSGELLDKYQSGLVSFSECGINMQQETKHGMVLGEAASGWEGNAITLATTAGAGGGGGPPDTPGTIIVGPGGSGYEVLTAEFPNVTGIRAYDKDSSLSFLSGAPPIYTQKVASSRGIAGMTSVAAANLANGVQKGVDRSTNLPVVFHGGGSPTRQPSHAITTTWTACPQHTNVCWLGVTQSMTCTGLPPSYRERSFCAPIYMTYTELGGPESNCAVVNEAKSGYISVYTGWIPPPTGDCYWSLCFARDNNEVEYPNFLDAITCYATEEECKIGITEQGVATRRLCWHNQTTGLNGPHHNWEFRPRPQRGGAGFGGGVL